MLARSTSKLPQVLSKSKRSGRRRTGRAGAVGRLEQLSAPSAMSPDEVSMLGLLLGLDARARSSQLSGASRAAASSIDVGMLPDSVAKHGEEQESWIELCCCRDYAMSVARAA